MFNLLWYKAFVHWVEITQFADGFRLNTVLFVHILNSRRITCFGKIFEPCTVVDQISSSPQYSERKPAAYTTGYPPRTHPGLFRSFGAKWTKMGSKVWKFSVCIAGKLQPKALGRTELRFSSTKPSLPILTLYTKVTLAEICIRKIAYIVSVNSTIFNPGFNTFSLHNI